MTPVQSDVPHCHALLCSFILTLPVSVVRLHLFAEPFLHLLTSVVISSAIVSTRQLPSEAIQSLQDLTVIQRFGFVFFPLGLFVICVHGH